MPDTEVAFTHYTDFYTSGLPNRPLRHQGAREQRRVALLRELEATIDHHQCNDVSLIAHHKGYLPMFQSTPIGHEQASMESIVLEAINGQVPTAPLLRHVLERLGLHLGACVLALAGKPYHLSPGFLGTLSAFESGKECPT